MWFLRQGPGWSDKIFVRDNFYPGKRPKKSQRAKRKFWGQQVLFGTKYLKFGPERANLATLLKSDFHAHGSERSLWPKRLVR